MEDFQFLRRLPARRSNSLGDTVRPSSSFMTHGYWSSIRSPLRCLFWTSTLGTTCPAVGAAGFLQVCSQMLMAFFYTGICPSAAQTLCMRFCLQGLNQHLPPMQHRGLVRQA